MGFSARSLAVFGLVALVVVPAGAAAQTASPAKGPTGATTAAAPPPAGGTAPAESPPAAAGTDGAAQGGAAAEKKPGTGSPAGYAYSDKPVRRGPTKARILHKTGPLATFPGFAQLPDGGSRLVVQLSTAVPVEERRAKGTITYVLKGAHLRVHNDANALVTVHFNTPVARARLVPKGADLLFVVDLRAASTPTFKTQDNPDKTSTLTVDFAKGTFVTGPAPAPAVEPAPAGEGDSNGDGDSDSEDAPSARKKPAAAQKRAPKKVVPPAAGTGPTP